MSVFLATKRLTLIFYELPGDVKAAVNRAFTVIKVAPSLQGLITKGSRNGQSNAGSGIRRGKKCGISLAGYPWNDRDCTIPGSSTGDECQ